MKNINILTKEELVRTKNHCLTVGDLRRILEDKTISDDTIVLVERITDYYFENNNWGVYLEKGYHYSESEQWNKDIDSGKYLNTEEYPNMKPEYLVKHTEEEMEPLKEEFHPAHGFYINDGLLFIKSHY